MKPKLLDYLLIFTALVAIFVSGLGVGHVLGKKARSASQHEGSPKADNGQPSESWKRQTLLRLQKELELSQKQEQDVEQILERTFAKIRKARENALDDYYQALLDTHDDIIPLLNEEQQKQLRGDREDLHNLLKQRR
jgi:molecular chaperone GrpE (heat shock protein)